MIYNKLREVRIDRGMSITELARRSELSRITITNIENLNSNPTQKTITSICNVLEKDPNEIFFSGNVNHELQ